jgi:electron transfer flavoprotein beta subunit
VHIVVLLKAVPVVGTERLDAAWRTERTQLEANGADEYTLERALQLTEAHGGEVTLLTMGPAPAVDALRKGLAMGAARAVHVQDDALGGACIRSTVDVLAAALGRLTFDLAFVGADTSDGSGGVVGAAVAARLGLPYLDLLPALRRAQSDGEGDQFYPKNTHWAPAGQRTVARALYEFLGQRGLLPRG